MLYAVHALVILAELIALAAILLPDSTPTLFAVLAVWLTTPGIILLVFDIRTRKTGKKTLLYAIHALVILAELTIAALLLTDYTMTLFAGLAIWLTTAGIILLVVGIRTRKNGKKTLGTVMVLSSIGIGLLAARSALIALVLYNWALELG